jgi:multisubunit Na+/H+ antiporter MnhB subunit
VYAGHAALATLAKGARPRIPIALLVPIAFAPDWIEWFFDFFGYRNREISHSLVSVGIGATLVALAYYLTTREGVDAMTVWLTYASHWPADFITGLKPTWPGGPIVGLFLYSHSALDGILECSIVVLCWLVYRRSLPRAAQKRAVGLLVPLGLIAMQLAFMATTNPALRK